MEATASHRSHRFTTPFPRFATKLDRGLANKSAPPGLGKGNMPMHKKMGLV